MSGLAACYVKKESITSHRRFIEVPTKPHIKTFITNEYGENGVLVAKQNQFLGVAVATILEKIPHLRVKSRKKAAGCFLKIYLPDEIKHAKVSEQSIELLSTFFEKLLFEKLCSFVRYAHEVGLSERGAVTSFLKIYDIENEVWDYDAAYSCWKRRKQAIVKQRKINLPL